MKSSEILRKCARAFERDDAYSGLCYMTKDVAGYTTANRGSKAEQRAYNDSERAMKYVKQFASLRAKTGKYWFGGPCRMGGSWPEVEAQDLRILAACFAAAVAESEGD